MTDYGKAHRQALIAGQPAPRLTNEAKCHIATRYLGNRHILAGGNPDWTKPTILPAWLSGRPGAVERTAAL
jgi:hypothetical protein